MMRKICIFLVIITATVTISNAQVRWNIQAGMTLNNLTKVNDSRYLPGFQAGLGFSYFFSDDLTLDPSILIVSKGFATKEVANTTYQEMPIYIQLPIYVSYNLMLDYQFGLEFGAGPFVSYGLGGTSKGEMKAFGIDTSAKQDLFTKDGLTVFKDRLDAGFGARAGVTFRNIALLVGVERGLLDVNDSRKETFNSYGFSIALQYRF